MAHRHHDPRRAMGRLAKAFMAVGAALLLIAGLLTGLAAYRLFVIDAM